MNKVLGVFVAVLVLGTFSYVSMSMWNYQTTLKIFGNVYHNMVNSSRNALTLHGVGKEKHQEMHQQKLQQDFHVHNKTRNETSRNQTKLSDFVVSKGNGSLKTISRKYLIYLCHGGSCGGWSDRQRGILSVYILSVVTDRKFGMIMDKPCDVTDFYVPNDVNWIIPAADLKNKTSITVNDMGSRGGIQEALRRGFNQRYPQDVVYIKTNNANYRAGIAKIEHYARKLPEWAKSTKNSAVFAQGWKILMKPSPYLQHCLDNYLQSIAYEQRTSPLVCSHVRIGRSKTLKTDGRSRMDVSDIPVLWKFLDQYVQDGSKLFLATDNLEVRNLTRQRFGASMSDTGGAIVHVDKYKGARDPCNGFGYAVLDQLILTKCDVLVLTRSGFGTRASFLRANDKNLFRFLGNKVIKLSR